MKGVRFTVLINKYTPEYLITSMSKGMDYGESDMWNHLFGFCKIENYIDSATGGRLFKGNGEPVFIRGGNLDIVRWFIAAFQEAISNRH
ncbi:mannosylglycoprotein endo-beta-mannosidase-like [Spinacia oleracea]|uniref:Mannosylglycoprotein endo-beta-mannosidase-like n=1 Tax=Spinacia oleracea TaxID=3562 RepID=A0ABM3RW94_SPIOL|nr:mannosylglycoprotein endo-beta-mannosidase-like [Spinacia oleracea]